MLMVGLLLGGHLSFELFPDRDTDTIVARVTMPQGTPLAQTEATTARLEAAGRQLDDHFRAVDPTAAGVVKQIMTVVGINTDFEPEVGSHIGEVTVELLAAEQRGISSTLLADKWRDLSGDVPDALELIFMSEDIFPVGKPIEVRLMGENFAEMREAAARLEAELATYPGVLDISNDFRPGKMEVQLALKPAGRVLGITLADLAGQVNQGFFGAEALRLQRGRDDVKVVIRYPEAERRSLGDLDNIRIRTPNGSEVPFHEVATATLRRGFSVIKRSDRQRALSVTADVDSTKANAEKILADLQTDYLPRLLADYENMRYSFEGQHKETQRSVGSLFSRVHHCHVARIHDSGGHFSLLRPAAGRHVGDSVRSHWGCHRPPDHGTRPLADQPVRACGAERRAGERLTGAGGLHQPRPGSGRPIV